MRERECETLNRAVKLAPKVGLDPTEVKCPYNCICSGRSCLMIVRSNLLPFSDTADRFYEKVKKELEKVQ